MSIRLSGVGGAGRHDDTSPHSLTQLGRMNVAG